MKPFIRRFNNSQTAFYFDANIKALAEVVDKNKAILVTDQHLFNAHPAKFKTWKTIVIPAGEQYKNQQTVDAIIRQLIELGADRTSMLIGVGGGVVTDVTGYVAGIYMRGIAFGFVPTSILAMVDASIGGKNGIDVGLYKNMVGLIRQPSFILYDYALLKTLPNAEWINGFAEIIKHACIRDKAMFSLLAEKQLGYFQKNKQALSELIKRNALLKVKIVMADETEQGDRKLLNFGHTFGHAIENQYALPHGHAVAIGMVMASHISQLKNGFSKTESVIQLIEQYELPTHAAYDKNAVLALMKGDKKKKDDCIQYVLLQSIGKAQINPISFTELEQII